ncbi:MAG: polyisoprenoid-binding protein [Deltaproteobacteria bacterium HGW-Deltaproteobacteria-14]|jgi:polyisoprenoid-binding protein YceI|nr:MAG: polyisoprenoid-binding protein [Deltaproteobacteria bacterium HGW-Deltaproteobacteria-14]
MTHTVRTLALLTLALALPTLAANSASAASYAIDNVHTSVLFKVSHFGIAPFYGRFNSVAGTFEFDAAAADRSKLSLQIDVASIFTADRKRDDHLKSPDFFNAKQFPTITLESARVKAGTARDTYVVEANLTVRGVTKAITFTMTKTGEGSDPMGNARIGFEGSFTINRLDYGVSYAPEGLGKDVTIIFAVEGIKG